MTNWQHCGFLFSKSISSAGRALGLSTTMASKRLQDLEATLDVRLVDRTTQRATR
jgi:DNA-binding transcriptional LysR family regulator